MRSNLTENKIKDEVVRARSACWTENVYKEAIDVSRYPKIGVVEDTNNGESFYGVVAFKEIDNDDNFEVLIETANRDVAESYYKKLLEKLQNGPMVH